MADVIEITAEVRDRELRLTSIPMMPSGSRNHLRIRVAFDAEWEGTTKTLVAYRDLSKPYHVPLGLDGTALIPHEVLAEQGVVYLGVFGVAGDQRITSTIVRYGVNEGALTEGLQPSDPTPEMWEQLISAVNEVRQAAESAMRGAQTAAQGAQKSEQAAQQSATQAQESARSAGDSAASATQAQHGAADAETAARQSAAMAQKSQETAAQAAAEAGEFAQQIAGAIDRLVIHETATGNPVVIRDGADWQIERMRVYGQSEQVTTTGAQMFDASTRIVGGIIDNGVQASNSRYACSDYIPIPDGTSHLYQFGGALNQRGFYGVDKAYLSKPTTNNVIDVPEGAKYIRITSDIDKQDMGNIMLCVGNTAKPFEPYTGGKPAPSPEYPQDIVSKTVTEISVTGDGNAQTVTLSAPVTLRGVPVSSGGNVTINGQQYVADRITEREGVVGIERWVKWLELPVAEMNNSESSPGWMRKGFTENLSNPVRSMTTHLPQNAISANFKYDIVFFHASGMTQSEWKSKYPDLVISAVVRINEPSFEPLPDADQRAIRALRTYHGNTVVTTGAHTEVDYVADPKLYIDGKVTSLVTAYMQSIPVTIPLLDEEVVDNEG